MRRKCLRATFAGAVLFLAGCQKQANEPSVQTVTAGVVESIQGTGLIWRLSSITRLEERDGGVYAELEAIALSRDIPAVSLVRDADRAPCSKRFARHISSPNEGCHR